MTAERKGFKIRLPNLFPEGLSVLKPMMEDIDRQHRADSESRARVQERLTTIGKVETPTKNQQIPPKTS